jgi:hypothetical protein
VFDDKLLTVFKARARAKFDIIGQVFGGQIRENHSL